MDRQISHRVSRRRFLQTATVAVVGLSAGPHFVFGKTNVGKPMKRAMGKLNFEATTLGLGGQASLQWTPDDVDPVKIILKAYELGVNYYDTSNAYGPSQLNYGKAFRELHLAPGISGYDEAARRSIFLTSKTVLRWGKGGWQKPSIVNFTNGPQGSTAIDDLKRTLSQVFGDGKGSYPPGAYLDMMLMHHVAQFDEVDALYEGLDHPDPKAENIGAFAALLDYRDGTNRTGLNPKEEKLIRHIGFSGHHSPPVMMEMLQRDERGLLDGMLVAVNANDRMQFNMQYNCIPVASAKNMGLIAMKTFADGAMYTKPATWSIKPEHVVRTVGSDQLSSRSLIEYSLSTPGIHTLIIGTGQIDADAKRCQLQQNMSAAQILPKGLSLTDRRAVERLANQVKDGKTNYFQVAKQDLTPVREFNFSQEKQGKKRIVHLSWQSAYAGDEPIARYEVWRDGLKFTEIAYTPQTTKKPLGLADTFSDNRIHKYQVRTVDAVGRMAASGELPAPVMG